MHEINVDISSPAQRNDWVRGALRLQWLTLLWNTAEGSIALLAGAAAGSVALMGFGIDSLIENASAGVVAWRLWREVKGAPDEDIAAIETKTRKVAGILLLLLAAYVAFDAIRQLSGIRAGAHESLPGLVVTVAALIVMPLLAKAKLKAAELIGSAALRADAMQSTCCAWLSGATLLGLALNAAFHWWWADSLAACAIVPLLAREGLEALRGEQCGCHDKHCESGTGQV